MLTGEFAKSQIEDRVRAAQMDRMVPPRSGRQGRRPVVRKVGSGILAAVTATMSRRPAKA
jgi:hypothetical protein